MDGFYLDNKEMDWHRASKENGEKGTKEKMEWRNSEGLVRLVASRSMNS